MTEFFEHAPTPRSPEQKVEGQLRRAKEFMYRQLGPGINLGVRTPEGWRGASYGEMDAGRGETGADTLYDLASMTKLVTALQVLELVSASRLKLHDRLGEYLPFHADSGLRVQDVLAHRGAQMLGATKYARGVEYGREELKDIFENPNNLVLERAEDYNYGDLGYLHLGLLLEHIQGKQLKEITAEFAKRYELGELLYNPTLQGVSPEKIARAEESLAPGVVQDDKARWYEGAAGHAGLYGSRRTLENLVERLYSEEFALTREIYARLYTPEYPASPQTGMAFSIAGIRRGLYSQQPNVSGYGGSSMFLDPERQSATVHTCNITYPRRDRENRAKFREWNRKLGS